MSTAVNTIPSRLNLANLPTPIEALQHLSTQYGKSLYMKRDDYTGTELSGNKIRKLEFAIADALAQGAKVLITCGGLQSNHARATAATARKLGLDVHLVLRSETTPEPEGNYLLDILLGAKITFLTSEDFSQRHTQVMSELKAKYDAAGTPAYILPIGASNGIGNFGYCHAFEEILAQERNLGIHFDTIVCTVGSGGTYGGLFLGNMLSGQNRNIVGINISATAEYFQTEIARIVNNSLELLEMPPSVTPEAIRIIDGYAGLGYALSQPEEIDFIRSIAMKEGIILDPVYTGKAFRGLITELEKGTLSDAQNILFIHTGGMLGFVPNYMKLLSDMVPNPDLL